MICGKATADRAANEIEITDAMIEAGERVFWDYAEDRYAVTYDPSRFIKELWLVISAAKRGDER